MAPQLGQIDPDVKIPPAVLRDARLSEELHKKVYTKPEPTPEETVSPDTPPAPEVTSEVTPAETVDKSAKIATEVTSEVTLPSPPTKVLDDKSWEHKYNSMKGRWEQSQSQIRDLSAQILNLQSTVNNLQRQGKETPPEPTPERFITDQEVQDYGQDLLNVVGKKAKEIVTPEVRALREQVAQLQARLDGVNQTVTGDRRQQLLAYMDQHCPNWLEINNDQRFIDWLALQDLYSGAIRHNLLKEAFERNDAPRLLAFFKGFLAEEAALAPAPVKEPEPARQPKVSLQDIAAPGRAKSAAAPSSTPAEKPIFTTSQITAFYTDVASGRYRGREEEKNRLESQIFLAQAEGRIRDG